MNFSFDCEKVLGCDKEGIAIIEPSHKEFLKVYNYIAICEILDSQRGMKQSSTSSDKFFSNEKSKYDKIFIKAEGNSVIGYLKMGTRRLFLSEGDSNISEFNVQCVLDFFVYHTRQKQGHGKSLFDKMLRFVNTQPYKLAYDTPNRKLLSFLYKHYSLVNAVKQNNSYIVFKEFFIGRNSNSKVLDYNYVLKLSNLRNNVNIVEDKKENKIEQNYLNSSFDSHLIGKRNNGNMQTLGEQIIKNPKFSSSSTNSLAQSYNMNEKFGIYSPIYDKNKSRGLDNININNLNNYNHQFTPNNPNNAINNTNINPNSNLNLLNSNIDKRFHNYFFNDETGSIRTSSTHSNYSQRNRIDVNEYKKKFNTDAYLKNLIQNGSKEFDERVERLKVLESQVYRNPNKNFYTYEKKNNYATIFDNIK